MNHKRESGSQAAVLARRSLGEGGAELQPSPSLTNAMDALVHGYTEEMALYSTVRALTCRQRDILRDEWNLDQFGDLLDEKEDLLKMIGQIESVMKKAKSLVLTRKPPQCPNRWKLERLLDQLTAVIEEIRTLEGANAAMLEDALASYELDPRRATT